LEKLNETVEVLQTQLLEKDEKYGHLLEEKDGEIARLAESHQAELKQATDDKEANLRKLEIQIQNSVQM